VESTAIESSFDQSRVIVIIISTVIVIIIIIVVVVVLVLVTCIQSDVSRTCEYVDAIADQCNDVNGSDQQSLLSVVPIVQRFQFSFDDRE
jgi:hypothetical protein